MFLTLLVIGFHQGFITINVKTKSAQAANFSAASFIDTALSHPSDIKKLQKKLMKSTNVIERFSPVQIKAVFSEPSLLRSDGNYSIWQYKNEYCVLDLYFNSSISNTVMYYEIRKKSVAYSPHKNITELTVIDQKTCIEQFLI
jgi:hypothetical protein